MANIFFLGYLVVFLFPKRAAFDQGWIKDSLWYFSDEIFPICSESDERWEHTPENPTKAPFRVGVLPSARGSSFQIVLFENGSLPIFDYIGVGGELSSETFPLISCYLRLEACSQCRIQLEYERPNKYLNESDIKQVSLFVFLDPWKLSYLFVKKRWIFTAHALA